MFSIFCVFVPFCVLFVYVSCIIDTCAVKPTR